MTAGGALPVGCDTVVFTGAAGGGWVQAPLKGPILKQMEKPLMSLQNQECTC